MVFWQLLRFVKPSDRRVCHGLALLGDSLPIHFDPGGVLVQDCESNGVILGGKLVIDAVTIGRNVKWLGKVNFKD